MTHYAKVCICTPQMTSSKMKKCNPMGAKVKMTHPITTKTWLEQLSLVTGQWWTIEFVHTQKRPFIDEMYPYGWPLHRHFYRLKWCLEFFTWNFHKLYSDKSWLSKPPVEKVQNHFQAVKRRSNNSGSRLQRKCMQQFILGQQFIVKSESFIKFYPCKP